MPNAMYNLYLWTRHCRKSKKFMVHMSDRSFYMVRMPEAISDPTQI